MDVSPIRFWCQKVLPLVYDDSLSYYEQLCKILCAMQTLIDDMKSLGELTNEHSKLIEELQNKCAEIEKTLNDVKNGKYVGLYLDSIKNWINDNLICLVAQIAKFVTFGLTDDGYFCAYIPSNWDFLKFDTCMDFSSPCYGHLILEY